MPSKLIPEKPLLVSPSLAATIGLEEALMVQTLHEHIVQRGVLDRKGFCWLSLDVSELLVLFPFWQIQDCQRIAASLKAEGVLLIDSPPLNEARRFRCAINERERATGEAVQQPTPQTARYGGKTLLSPGWQPDEQILRQLEMNQVSREFALAQIEEFVSYWRERAEPAYSWNSKFRSQVMRRWREREAMPPSAADSPVPMQRDWRPSEDAVIILTRAGIPRDFVFDAVPEFVLYWVERGDPGRTWNSRFVTHVKRQWQRCTQSLPREGEPRPLPSDWTPQEDVYDILRLANIDPGFAESLLPEFVLYWRDRGEVSPSWNSKFLQFTKHQWARQHRLSEPESGHDEESKQTGARRSTRSRSLAEDLSDLSWAD